MGRLQIRSGYGVRRGRGWDVGLLEHLQKPSQISLSIFLFSYSFSQSPLYIWLHSNRLAKSDSSYTFKILFKHLNSFCFIQIRVILPWCSGSPMLGGGASCGELAEPRLQCRRPLSLLGILLCFRLQPSPELPSPPRFRNIQL